MMTTKLLASHEGQHVHVRVFSGPDKDHLALNRELTFTREEWEKFWLTLFQGAYYMADYQVVIDDDQRWAEKSNQLFEGKENWDKYPATLTAGGVVPKKR